MSGHDGNEEQRSIKPHDVVIYATSAEILKDSRSVPKLVSKIIDVVRVRISFMALLQCLILRTYPVSDFGPLTTWMSYECRMRQPSLTELRSVLVVVTSLIEQP